MGTQPYHIFTKAGDVRPELEDVLQGLGVEVPEQAGYHKSLYVTRANQTVVFVAGAESLLAEALRARKGWQEPEQ
jgi:hypothetical protein